MLADDRLARWQRTGSPVDGNCAHHGSFTAISYAAQQRVTCPTCEQDAREAQHQKDAALRREERRQEALNAANLRGRFRETTLGTFDATTPAQRKVLEACKAFAAGPFDAWRVLFLIGPVGAGKTHLGSAMAHAAIARRHDARVVTCRELVRALRATWSRSSEQSEEDVINEFAQCGLLVLDELGVGFGTETEVLQVLDVIDVRYRLRRPSVVISNLNMEQIRAAVGDRLFDRLRENAEVHACNWPSHRRAAT